MIDGPWPLRQLTLALARAAEDARAALVELAFEVVRLTSARMKRDCVPKPRWWGGV